MVARCSATAGASAARSSWAAVTAGPLQLPAHCSCSIGQLGWRGLLGLHGQHRARQLTLAWPLSAFFVLLASAQLIK